MEFAFTPPEEQRLTALEISLRNRHIGSVSALPGLSTGGTGRMFPDAEGGARRYNWAQTRGEGFFRIGLMRVQEQ